MTNQNIIRLLSGLTFLIFFCPFFQMCSDSSHLKKTLAEQPKTQTEIIREKERQEKELREFKKAWTYSGYKMATYIFEPKALKKITPEDLLDSTFYTFLSFTLTLIISIFIFIQSLRKKFTAVYKPALLNLLFAVIPIAIFLIDGVLEELSQIKFGYYLFIINTIALIIFSREIRSKNAV